MTPVRHTPIFKFLAPVLTVVAVSASLFVSLQARADLNTSVAEYVQSAQIIGQQLVILKKHAPSCGMIGGQIGGRMDESIIGQHKEIEIVLNAVKQGKAGENAIRVRIGEAEKSNAELKSNLSMARYGLTGGDASCKMASVAFDTMVSQTLAIPKKLKSILAAL
jgi:hypothetical protein